MCSSKQTSQRASQRESGQLQHKATQQGTVTTLTEGNYTLGKVKCSCWDYNLNFNRIQMHLELFRLNPMDWGVRCGGKESEQVLNQTNNIKHMQAQRAKDDTDQRGTQRESTAIVSSICYFLRLCSISNVQSLRRDQYQSSALQQFHQISPKKMKIKRKPRCKVYLLVHTVITQRANKHAHSENCIGRKNSRPTCATALMSVLFTAGNSLPF